MFANKRIKRQRLEQLYNREEVPDPHKHLNPADAQRGTQADSFKTHRTIDPEQITSHQVH